MNSINRREEKMPFIWTIVVNGGYNQERANAVLTSQQADLVSFGKLFIANPDLPRRFLLNAPLNQIDPTTLGGTGEKGYTDYPFLTPITNVRLGYACAK